MLRQLIEAGAIGRRKLVLSLALATCVMGLAAFLNMAREDDPAIEYSTVSIQVPLPGVSPEDADRLLVRPLEVQLRDLDGLKHMNATGREGFADVELEFEPAVDKARALAEVRAKANLARGRFPLDAEEPVIESANSAQSPVLGLVLWGPVPPRELYLARTLLKSRLERTPGVLDVRPWDDTEEVLEVTLDPRRLEALGVTAGEIGDAIGRNNQLVPAGVIRSGGGQFTAKVPGVVERPEDVGRLIVRRNGDRIVTLADLGEVRRTFKDPTHIRRYNGQPAVFIEVAKSSGADTIRTAAAIRAAVVEQRARWPAGVGVDYTFDESEFIAGKLGVLERFPCAVNREGFPNQ
ncbi:efflux RND transporter permease subunit [Phenylobacterium sp.]|uniref:efflux RND transporter permease subunit n=1 Tax=Phenylobacterium sp. TaxID=1871053 RepID=UPI0025E6B0C3|nr:efflux RND transporter permease subunit [Phenylobacterium sp.]MCA3586090.1 efflux RND transporter permease subunit [Methylocystis sp.]MCA6346410.1 efflux RND transporter permease subunit [Phenylobacterium sp.]MCA6355394.1 efflux RND transporter permease subunit [Phenylobacterium sp.]MCA6358255.1 efflux RND transporter permease subunit [Phenylobacterium sp.]MCA6361384.1 efflux RND transporter permease subunit [Phenylobacterium sp.]